MKRLIAVGLAVLIASPAFACGPMTSGGSGQMTSSGTGETKRQQWTKKRIKELKTRRQQNRGGFGNSDVRGFPFSISENPYLSNSAEAQAELRRRDAVRRQRMIDAIEFLALKKERGELSPEGQRKLNELLRRVRTEGH